MPAASVVTPSRHTAVHRLAVSRIERLTEDAVALTLDVPPELCDEYAFVQGQHIALSLPDSTETVRRSYSICTPAPDGELTVVVKHLAGGVLSSHVHTRLRVGDELDVLTPTGRFFTPLDPAQAKNYAAVAAGSGIAPILSIATTTLDVEPESTFTILYGNRTTASTLFLDELLDLKNREPERLALQFVFSREPSTRPLGTGRIDAAKLGVFLNTVFAGCSFDEWFLCGPLEMVEDLRTALLGRGVDPRHVRRELFHAGPTADRTSRTPVDSASTSTVTVVLNGRATSFELPRDGERILHASLTVRSDTPYACTDGVCGTCRARIVEGEVEMVGGYALEDDERQAGFVLTCQSHPRSPRVTLDFDS